MKTNTNEQVGYRNLYQSPGMKDIAMDILFMVAMDEGSVDMVVEWWNVGPHAPFSMGTSQRFTMPLSWVKELEEYIYNGELFTIPGIG